MLHPPSTAISVFGPPVLAAAGASLVYMIPTGILMALATWTLLSVPAGIFVGHCTSSGD
ncbi:MAG TPA: hypothetical protein VHO91_17870 [Rhodopila sp.]|nr:hypothetical protein [Rhodopila sp.]